MLIDISFAIIVSKVFALLLVVMAMNTNLRKLVLESPTSTSEHSEYSVFLVAISTTAFHLLGNFVSVTLSQSNVDKTLYFHFFYLGFCFFELLFIFTVITLHNIKNCRFSKISAHICYMSVLVIVLQLIRYTERAVFEVDVFGHLYRALLISTSIIVPMLISCFAIRTILIRKALWN